MRSKKIKYLIISFLAFAMFMAFTVCAYAATPEFVCKECGVDLTYESDGEEFDLTHPSGGSCSHAGKSLHNSLTWAQTKSAAAQQPATKIHVCSECGATVTYSETLAGYKVSHPDGSCSHAGESYEGRTEPDWVKESTQSGGNGSGSSGSTEQDYGICGVMIDTIFGVQGSSNNNSLLGDLANPISALANSADTVDDTVQDLVNEPFYYGFQAIAITIVLFYFMSGLLTRDLSQNFGKPTLEMLARPFGRVIVVITMIIFSWDICRFFLWLSQFGLSQVVKLGTSTVLGSGAAADIKKTIMDACGWQDLTNAGVLDRIFGNLHNMGITMQVMISFLIPFVVSIVCNVVAVWVVLTRTVTLIIYSVMSPLAMSDLYGEHHFKETNAFRWLKKYFGLCIQSSVIVLAYYIANKVCGGFMDQIFNNVGGSLGFGDLMNMATYIAVLKVVQVGVVLTSAHKAQEIVS